MKLPFWRIYRPDLARIDHWPAVPTLMMFDDGNGFRPVTDIEWAMWYAFARIDSIIAEGARKLDDIKLTMGEYGSNTGRRS